MKPGDLVTIRRMNLTNRVPITYVDVYEKVGDEFEYDGDQWKWEHGETGLLLEGRDADQEIAEVLHNGRVGWVYEELIQEVK